MVLGARKGHSSVKIGDPRGAEGALGGWHCAASSLS
jgi:hypothetical protein